LLFSGGQDYKKVLGIMILALHFQAKIKSNHFKCIQNTLNRDKLNICGIKLFEITKLITI